MRFFLLLTTILASVAIACTASPNETPTVTPHSLESTVPETADWLPSTPLVSALWTAESVIEEIADQLFQEAARPAHIFGLNVEEGEEFVPSGRDVLPPPPSTEGWRAEFEGDGVWIVDTGELIYRFFESDARFDVIHVYANGQ